MMNEHLMSRFWHVLFDPEDHTCYARHMGDKLASPIANRNADAISFSINALTPGTTRASLSVSKFRSFLLEFDKGTPQEQLDYLKNMKCPFTSIVHSGGKSYHVIVTLEEPLKDLATYNNISRWLHSIMSRSDQVAIDPSRMSRIPGAVRPETGNEQYLLYVGSRVSNSNLASFLKLWPDHQPNQEVSAGLIRSEYPVDRQTAINHCNEMWPLESGSKQNFMMSWAVYLAGNTNLTKDEVIEILADNDRGSTPLDSEYVRVADRGFAKFGQ